MSIFVEGRYRLDVKNPIGHISGDVDDIQVYVQFDREFPFVSGLVEAFENGTPISSQNVGWEMLRQVQVSWSKEKGLTIDNEDSLEYSARLECGSVTFYNMDKLKRWGEYFDEDDFKIFLDEYKDSLSESVLKPIHYSLIEKSKYGSDRSLIFDQIFCDVGLTNIDEDRPMETSFGTFHSFGLLVTFEPLIPTGAKYSYGNRYFDCLSFEIVTDEPNSFVRVLGGEKLTKKGVRYLVEPFVYDAETCLMDDEITGEQFSEILYKYKDQLVEPYLAATSTIVPGSVINFDTPTTNSAVKVGDAL